MKITSYRIDSIKSELYKPFVTNLRRVDSVEDVLLILFCDDGTYGVGEAPPTVAITGEDRASIEQCVENVLFPAIRDIDIEDERLFTSLHRSTKGHTSAKACVDIAIYDLLAKNVHKPLCEFLGGTRKPIVTNLTISLGDEKQMLEDALTAARQGFRILKIKLGPDEAHSIQVVKSMREQLPSTVLRLDANQAWDAKMALRIADSLYSCNIELIEQPVKAREFAQLQEVTRHSSIPILADESVFTLDDAKKIIAEHAADYLNIKLMKSGGIHTALEIATLAQKNDVSVMMGSMLESVVSVSAAAHFAMSMPNVCFYDLDGPLLAKPSAVHNALRVANDELSLEFADGIGIVLDDTHLYGDR